MLEVIILAAGKGTRIRSSLPKVLHLLAGKPLVSHILSTAQLLQPKQIHVVVGHEAKQVQAEIEIKDVQFHIQLEQLGTAHAVSQALPACQPESTVLILFGDTPLLSLETLSRLVELTKNAPVMLSARLDDPGGYGRVIRNTEGDFLEVVEQKDGNAEQLAVNEVNSGVLGLPCEIAVAITFSDQ